MHALDLAIRYIDSGDDYIIILGGGITSQGIQIWKQPNQKTIFLFGDAVVAVLIGYSEVKHFLASYLMTNHLLYDNALFRLGQPFLKTKM